MTVRSFQLLRAALCGLKGASFEVVRVVDAVSHSVLTFQSNVFAVVAPLCEHAGSPLSKGVSFEFARPADTRWAALCPSIFLHCDLSDFGRDVPSAPLQTAQVKTETLSNRKWAARGQWGRSWPSRTLLQHDCAAQAATNTPLLSHIACVQLAWSEVALLFWVPTRVRSCGVAFSRDSQPGRALLRTRLSVADNQLCICSRSPRQLIESQSSISNRSPRRGRVHQALSVAKGPWTTSTFHSLCWILHSSLRSHGPQSLRHWGDLLPHPARRFFPGVWSCALFLCSAITSSRFGVLRKGNAIWNQDDVAWQPARRIPDLRGSRETERSHGGVRSIGRGGHPDDTGIQGNDVRDADVTPVGTWRSPSGVQQEKMTGIPLGCPGRIESVDQTTQNLGDEASGKFFFKVRRSLKTPACNSCWLWPSSGPNLATRWEDVKMNRWLQWGHEGDEGGRQEPGGKDCPWVHTWCFRKEENRWWSRGKTGCRIYKEAREEKKQKFMIDWRTQRMR